MTSPNSPLQNGHFSPRSGQAPRRLTSRGSLLVAASTLDCESITMAHDITALMIKLEPKCCIMCGQTPLVIHSAEHIWKHKHLMSISCKKCLLLHPYSTKILRISFTLRTHLQNSASNYWGVGRLKTGLDLLDICWSSADRRCSIYIWVINNLIAY